MNEPGLLPPHLAEFAAQLECPPEPGLRKHGDKTLSGWWLQTSTEDRIFCLDLKSRQMVENTKYLYKTGGGRGVDAALTSPLTFPLTFPGKFEFI